MSSSFSVRDPEEVDIALEVGSNWMGRRVKVSDSSMVESSLTGEGNFSGQ